MKPTTTRINFSTKVQIITDYLCSKLKLPSIVGKRAMRYFYNIPLGRKVDIPFPVVVYFILKCIQLSDVVHKWNIHHEVELDSEMIELASVLAERIYGYETPSQ